VGQDSVSSIAVTNDNPKAVLAMDSERLARYLAGEATASERTEVEAWAKADPANATELAQLQAGWLPPPASPKWDIDLAWQKVQHRLEQPAVEIVRIRPPLWIGWVAVAAIVLVGVGIARWWPRPAREQLYATAVAQQQTVHLPDGSVAMLAPDSRLTVPAGFGRGDREVTLQGHAWFAVHHDRSAPFRVVTGGAVIEDLGTEFVVEAHGSEVQVAVVSGSVSVRSNRPESKAVTLGPRDVALIGPNEAPAVSHEMAVDRIAGWRDGKLAFDGEPAALVLAELERWYPVHFTLADSTMATRHLFVTLPTADLQEAVEVIVGAMGATASQTGAMITLRARGAR
jgi:transmembrane sensor